MTMQLRTHSSYDHEDVTIPGAVVTSSAAKGLAVLRVATGFAFLWAFLDKLFGLHYATSSAKAGSTAARPPRDSCPRWTSAR